MQLKRTQRSNRRGFTLVEVLIVVVILGILAATVIPQFSVASQDAQESALIQDLQTLRSQIELYRFQHNGKYPAQGGTDTAVFEAQMLKTTKADGTADGPFGPYFIGQLPPNPFNGLRTVMITTTELSQVSPDDKTGWIYNSSDGTIKANSPSTVTTTDGTPVHEL